MTAAQRQAPVPRSACPFASVNPLPPPIARSIRRRAIFECCKWDPQVEDVATIADVPIVLSRSDWLALGEAAEALAAEVAAAEGELRDRQDLHETLGLPSAIRRALRRRRAGPDRNPDSGTRFVRFDFHHTEDGWRISEANTDVPGGLNEASGLPVIVAPHVPGTKAAGDVAGGYADALLAPFARGAHVALVHATAYADDRQVMTYLARRLEERGARVSLVSPAHLRWRDGRASLETAWTSGPVDAVARFYPSEWMDNLPRACGWPAFFEGTRTPVSNPATALLTQSKRFPLTWDRLETPMRRWRMLLPVTHDPRDVRWQNSDEWVLKPALGRVGEDVGIAGVTPAAEWTRIARDVTRHPSHWVAQRRFVATPLHVGDTVCYPGIGVYTVNTRVIGAYGRIADRPLIDARARDAAVLIGT